MSLQVRPATLSPEALHRDLAIRDLTDPAEGPHAIQILIDRAVSALTDLWGCEVRWGRGPRIVDIADNYDRLRIGGEAISREARYTRYVDEARVLRSHSSAMIPPALRALAEEARRGDVPDDVPDDVADDVLIVCPGLVYRRDSIDWQHTGTPHQLDVWRVGRGRPPMTSADLEEMIGALADALAPGRAYRSEDRVHPYTLEGKQVDVGNGGDWVEVCECGLAHPEVLASAGLGGWTGLALGMGLDRLLLMAKGIPDIRLLRSGDPRVAAQMLDLRPYAPVSSMPAVRRDISIATWRDDDVETIGDRVRDALGGDADAVEEVSVAGASPYEKVPPAARERLGMSEGQQNVLVRVLLRHLDRSLTNDEANTIRDRIYAALHEGSVWQWAGSRPSVTRSAAAPGSSPGRR
ncbi:MAG TPA: hypothetical protein VGS21_06625 [Acidimicrobiales bacterium]|nr:hypothetical protein [Acidimicrobiales bacterium]